MLSPAERVRKRADLYAQIRSFFCRHGVIETDAPLLSSAAASDLHIESIEAVIETHGLPEKGFLITSPEFFMKRLLSAGCPSLYYLGKVFRQGEHGPRHHHEFTMLEWYRLGWDEHQLMQEVTELLSLFLPQLPITKVSYAERFSLIAGANPHTASLEQLRECAARLCHQNHIETDIHGLSETDCLDFISSHFIEPELKGITLVYNYPASQAALAQLAKEGADTVARRFEVFIDGLEIGNGYYELTDPDEQRRRFEQDQMRRQAMGRPVRPLDTRLLQALKAGLPACAGVALGVDRLLMKICGQADIQGVAPLPGQLL